MDPGTNNVVAGGAFPLQVTDTQTCQFCGSRLLPAPVRAQKSQMTVENDTGNLDWQG